MPKDGVPNFTSQSVATREGLVDAMVFGDIIIDFTLEEALTPGSIPVILDSIQGKIK